MIDQVTEAIVLEKEYVGESDAKIHLYTKKFGKVRVRATSARKITSKLGPHLEPGMLISARLVSKNSDSSLIQNFRLADALASQKLFSDFKFLDLVKDLTLDMHNEDEMWEFLKRGVPDAENLLRISGFGTSELARF